MTKWSRLYVRFCRLFFWTVAADRQAWRDYILRMEYLKTARRGVEHIKVRGADGSVVKNVYVNHGDPYMSIAEGFLLDEYIRGRRMGLPR